MKAQRINPTRTLSRFVESSDGRFVTVTFRKLDGTIRKINGRTGVGDKAPTHNPQTHLLLWSMKDKGFRLIRKDSIIGVNSDHLSVGRK